MSPIIDEASNVPVDLLKTPTIRPPNKIIPAQVKSKLLVCHVNTDVTVIELDNDLVSWITLVKKDGTKEMFLRGA